MLTHIYVAKELINSNNLHTLWWIFGNRHIQRESYNNEAFTNTYIYDGNISMFYACFMEHRMSVMASQITGNSTVVKKLGQANNKETSTVIAPSEGNPLGTQKFPQKERLMQSASPYHVVIMN